MSVSATENVEAGAAVELLHTGIRTHEVRYFTVVALIKAVLHKRKSAETLAKTGEVRGQKSINNRDYLSFNI